MKFSASYLAGLFDGEGCIFIARRERKRQMTMPHYILTASICMCHRPVIEALVAQFGHSITVHKKEQKNPKHKTAYEVVLSSNEARDFLLFIYDDMFIKKEEARIALAFQEHFNQYRGRVQHFNEAQLAALIDYRERIRLQLKACKKVSFVGVSDWNVGEFGGHPMPGQVDAEGQYRAKQELTTPGMCNEQVPTPKGKICSALSGNTENAAEMTASHGRRLRLRLVE